MWMWLRLQLSIELDGVSIQTQAPVEGDFHWGLFPMRTASSAHNFQLVYIEYISSTMLVRKGVCYGGAKFKDNYGI